jgi:two-component system NarL family sensor kinase
MTTMRDFIFEVRPPSLDELGLGPTLQAMTERATTANGLVGHFADRVGEERLGGSIETVLYRTAQEALRNVVKHAKAAEVQVSVERTHTEAVLVVSDDGVGISEDPDGMLKHGHFGIQTMRERLELAGGKLEISTRGEGGTRLEARIPL